MCRHSIPKPIFDTLQQTKENLPQFKGFPSSHRKELTAALNFLVQYDGNQATFNSYRREVERLLHWSWLIQEQSIFTLRRTDIEAYVKFCIHPPKSWIGLEKVYRFQNKDGKRIANPKWHPFVVTLSKAEFRKGKKPNKSDYKPSQKAIREIFVALSSFYSYLLSENLLEANPVAAVRQKSKFIQKSQSTPEIPKLSDIQWATVLTTAQVMAEKDRKHHERTLFVINALYFMYLRISELIESERWSPQMCHFYQDNHRNWWFKTVGKGNKERDIVVSDNMLKALKHWRTYLGLSPELPTVNDKSPLIPKIYGQGNITSTSAIQRIVQNCFDNAIKTLNAKDKHQEAESLLNASAHWLRHTGISDDINKYHRPILHVRDDAGHASIATTDRYNDVTLQERHASKDKIKQTL